MVRSNMMYQKTNQKGFKPLFSVPSVPHCPPLSSTVPHCPTLLSHTAQACDGSVSFPEGLGQ